MKSIKYYREESEKKRVFGKLSSRSEKALLLSHFIRKRNFSDEVSGFTEKWEKTL